MGCGGAKIGVCNYWPLILEDFGMSPDLDTLATALYTRIDDLLLANPHWAPERPAVGIAPKLSDAELITLAVIQSLLRFNSEARFIRHARKSRDLLELFPYIPKRPGYNKRLRRACETMKHVIAALARECPSWYDDVWCVDSTPVECGRSRQTQKNSALAGWAEYGYCASHSRYFWGLRLHIIATPSGLPIAFALAGAKANEREVCLMMLDHDRLLRPGQVMITDKGYRSADFEAALNSVGMRQVRPAAKNEKPRPGKEFLRPFRQLIEAAIGTLKAQLRLENHHACTDSGVITRTTQCMLALTAAFWHNQINNIPGPARSLIAYDH